MAEFEPVSIAAADATRRYADEVVVQVAADGVQSAMREEKCKNPLVPCLLQLNMIDDEFGLSFVGSSASGAD